MRTLGLVRNLLSIVWLPFLGFLTFVFITGGYRFPAGLMAVDTETTGALLAVAVVLAVCLPRYRTPLALIVENYNLYRKLGVTSRAELLELVNG